MTQQEFEQRTGRTVLVKDFDAIHEIYMNTPYDKDKFCDIWNRDSDILKDLAGLQKEINSYKEYKSNMADFIMEQAERYGSQELRLKAIGMLGEKEYLRRKIARGYNLWKDDRELLNEILK